MTPRHRAEARSGVHGQEGGDEPRGETRSQVSASRCESEAAGHEPGANPESTACIK